MRRSHVDTQWLLTPDGRMLGIALGYDRCAEHEWGLDGLTTAFGVSLDAPIGLADRAITHVPQTLRYARGPEQGRDARRKALPHATLVYQDRAGDDATVFACARRELTLTAEPGDAHYRPARDDVAAGWSSRDFGIRVRGESYCQYLAELDAAFRARDIVFALGLRQPFGGKAGLTFVIDSRIDADTRTRVQEQDEARERLQQAVRASGIEARLKAAGKRWYALSPAWRGPEETDLRFFLNPMEQQRHTHGWFTVAELDAWIAGEGPVVLKTA